MSKIASMNNHGWLALEIGFACDHVPKIVFDTIVEDGT
jgi:hypothetical protein